MTQFDQLQFLFRQKEESQKVQDLKLKNRLRGGGCQVCKCQIKVVNTTYPSNYKPNYKPQVDEYKKILEVKEIKMKLIEHFNQNAQLQQFIQVITHCDNDCVIFTYQTIAIYLEMLQKQEYLKIESNQLFPIYESIQQISQDPEWLKIMLQFYFDLLEQANKCLTQSNQPIYKLLRNLNNQKQCTQAEWDQLKNQKDKFSSYETYYFYQMFLNKLIQPNSFGISLNTFVDDFINNQDQQKQINSHKLLIAAQLNLMNILSLTKQNQQLLDYFQKIYEVKMIYSKDDEKFINSIIKQQDKSYEETQIWLYYHFRILEHTQNFNKSIQDHITQFFETLRVYQQNFYVQSKQLKTRWESKNNQLEVISPLVNTINDVFEQQLNYKDQLDNVRNHKRNAAQQQQEYYITPSINITTALSKLEQTFDEEKIQNLFETEEEDIYWFFGKVKSGKTTLILKIIDYLWKNTDWIPIYFDLTEIEQNTERSAEFLKTSLKSEPFNLTDQQIQDFLNANERLVIFLDYFDQMSPGFRCNNIIDMLGYKDKQINQKLVIITREQVQDLSAYQHLIYRMIQIELKEFNEDQKKEYIEHLMDQEIKTNKININVQQMISIDFNGQLLIKEENVRQIRLQLTQENQQSIQKMVLNMVQLTFMMKNIFIPSLSFHYQFKVLFKLITFKNSQSSQQRFQEQNTSKNLIAHYQGAQKKKFEQLMNSSSSSNVNSSFENEELIEIDKILDLIMTMNQKYRLQQGNMLIKQILNPQLTKYEFINSLVDQYIEDSTQQILKEKVKEFQTNLALQKQQEGNSQQESQNESIKIIKRFCLLKTDGNNQIFIDQIFQDYFIAHAVYIEINQFIKDNSREKLVKFNTINLCHNDYTEAVALLSDQLLTISDIKDHLLSLIKLSKGESKYTRCSSNSMYLLSNLKQNLEGEDLCNIHISDIKIQGLSFYQANLSNSHWKNVDISNCNFNQANLKGAKLEQIIGIIDIEISAYLQLKEQSKIIGVLDPPSSSPWKKFKSKESQNIQNIFNTYEYFSFSREQSQIFGSSEQNNSIEENKESQICIIGYEENKLINTLKFTKHCSSFCFFTSKDQLICSLSENGKKYNINIWKYKKQNETQEIQQQFDKITKMSTHNNDSILVLLNNTNKILLIPLKNAQDYSYKLDIENKTEFDADNFTISNCNKFLAVHYFNEVKIYDWKMIEIQKFSYRNDWWRLVQYKSIYISFEKPQYNNIFDSQIENAQYSPDGQHIVLQFKSKTAFQKINTDTNFIEIEKVKKLVFSNNYFATSSDQGIKIYSFPECDLLDWLPFKAQFLIFSYKQEQKLAIISDFIFIFNLKNIEQTPPKIGNVNYEIQDSPLKIAVSPDNKYMTIAQNGLLLFIKDKVYNGKNEQYKDETILSMCFTKRSNHLAIRSKKNNQHIFRMINFITQQTTFEQMKDNQTEDTEFSNQLQCLLIQNRIYLISNQNNRLVLQDVTECCDNQEQNENYHKNKPLIILESTIKNEQILCFNFSISQDQKYIAACFSQKNKFKQNGSTIIIWKQNDKSLYDYENEQEILHHAGVNLYFLQYKNLLLLVFKENKQSCICLISIKKKNKTIPCENESIKSIQSIQSIVFSSKKEQFFTIHSEKSFSLYEIINKQLELKYYFQETEIPIYFSQTGTQVIYICQQRIFIRNVDDILERIKSFYQNGIQQQIDQYIGICFSESIMYFNHKDQKDYMIYQYSQNKITQIPLNLQRMTITCSQFSQDEQILIIISSKEGKFFLKILFKIENNYNQQNEEPDFDQIIYSCKFLTNSSFILVSKDILIYQISDCKSSVKQQINLANFFDVPRLQIKSINVHPNGKDFLTIAQSGQIQLYRLTQNKKYKLYKTLSRNLQAEGCVISNLNASDAIIEQLKQLGAVVPEEIMAS